MASHYSSIGFAIESPDALAQTAEALHTSAVGIETPRGAYFCWSSPSGAELWLQIDRDARFVGAHPHFAGSTRLRAGVTAHVNRDDDSALDGALHVWANPKDGVGDGDYPFIVECANYAQFARTPPPALAELQVAAFGREVEVFASEEAFDAAPADGELKYASRSFFPLSLFGDGPLNGQAYFTGHVLAAETRVNDYSGRAFQWALVETYGQTLDVVIDPEILGAPLQAGAIVKGTFWLSARIESMTTSATRWQQLRWKFRR